MAKISAKEYKDVKRILKWCLRAEGEYPRKDNVAGSPHPKTEVQTSLQPTGRQTSSRVCPGQSCFALPGNTPSSRTQVSEAGEQVHRERKDTTCRPQAPSTQYPHWEDPRKRPSRPQVSQDFWDGDQRS